MNRDLQAAGIPKRDERGRTVDVHAMRTTFGILLSKAGVFPRTAQAAMRHSDIGLTMNTYTDPKLLDVAGAVESLPALPLAIEPGRGRPAATGTENVITAVSEFVPKFAPTLVNSDTPGSIPDKMGYLGPHPKKGENPRLPQGNQGFSEDSSSRGDRRLTFLNDTLGTRLFHLAVAQVQEFSADTFFALGGHAA